MPDAPEMNSETSGDDDDDDDDVDALKFLDPRNSIIGITTINEPHRP